MDTRQVRGSNIRVPEDAVEERRTIAPPVRGITKKGAVLIRDMRVWHRGTPNTSAETRFMIGMIHSVPWSLRNQKKAPIRVESAWTESALMCLTAASSRTLFPSSMNPETTTWPAANPTTTMVPTKPHPGGELFCDVGGAL